jgi:signal transduction histidine kinase
MRRSTLWPYVLVVTATGAAAFAVVLTILAGDEGAAWWEVVAMLVTVGACVAIGLLIAVRRRGHPIGFLLLANGVLIASGGLAESYAQYAVLEQPGALPGGEWAVLWAQSNWPLLYGVLLAIIVVFPDGRLPSPQSRLTGAVVGAGVAALLATSFFDPERFEAPYEEVDRPLPALPEALAVLWPIAFLMIVVGMVSAVRAVRRRFREATGIERLQLRWLTYTAVLLPVTLLVCIAGSVLVGGVEEDAAFTALFVLMLGAIPSSIGLAVLRYRLYDIDRIINRTLVYGVLTALLAVAYAATTLVLGTALGSGSAWTTAGATLAAAGTFLPLRTRVQDAVDRRFARARYDARRRIAAFLEDLRAGRAAPEAVDSVLREVLEDPQFEVRFWLPESQVYVDARGTPVDDGSEDERERTPIERAGAPLGVVLHSPPDVERPGLLEEAVEAAGLAIEIARLRVELRRQLQEVKASRARIVSAGYEERRRIERDLHDGAQQRLVSIGLQLRHAQHELGASASGAGPTLDSAVEEIGQALQELRELAHGVRPVHLDDGLAPALRELADRVPVEVEVTVRLERCPPDIEVAAYFVASEALANAVKHARASKVSLGAEREDGNLIVTVSDDGVGGASPAQGSGLAGLADRVEAQGGSLRVASPPGQGTTVTAELPCG